MSILSSYLSTDIQNNKLHQKKKIVLVLLFFMVCSADTTYWTTTTTTMHTVILLEIESRCLHNMSSSSSTVQEKKIRVGFVMWLDLSEWVDEPCSRRRRPRRLRVGEVKRVNEWDGNGMSFCSLFPF